MSSKDKILIKIEKEIKRIDKNIEESKPYRKQIFKNDYTPDVRDINYMSNVITGFYNGLENILKIIIKDYLQIKISEHEKWHINLLNNAIDIGVFTEDFINKELDEYRAHRHINHNLYPHMLDWELFSHLVEKIEKVWSKAKTEISKFIDIILEEDSDN